MINILETVKKHWSWTGIDPIEVVTENDFGNLILRDSDGKFWRICPEDVYCEIIAETIEDYNLLITDSEFNVDWFMESMVSEAKNNIGPLKDGYKYYLVIAGVLGGEYGGKNIQSVPFNELIAHAGELGLQIKDLPDGSKIQIKVD